MESETIETTPETSAPTPTEPPPPPGMIGRLTPEEEQRLKAIREETHRLLQKIGEYELLKQRVLNRVNELDTEGQMHINSISQRLNIPNGQQWVARNDGMVLLISPQGEGTSS